MCGGAVEGCVCKCVVAVRERGKNKLEVMTRFMMREYLRDDGGIW